MSCLSCAHSSVQFDYSVSANCLCNHPDRSDCSSCNEIKGMKHSESIRIIKSLTRISGQLVTCLFTVTATHIIHLDMMSFYLKSLRLSQQSASQSVSQRVLFLHRFCTDFGPGHTTTNRNNFKLRPQVPPFPGGKICSSAALKYRKKGK